ncbi:DEAD/DEAH box helicase [Candidatus Desantisbacteria bacterium]|nr:DEAD/DEAH box helicase [Candidatus Desantisbacteria bacterium]
MINPLKALNQIIDEYRDFLLTEFRAKDPLLKEALEHELEKPGFLAQEPFFQAHRPFKVGKRWVELPIEKKLAQTLAIRAHSDFAYLHQSLSIEHLLGGQASPLVVTTGTGSGKTECFLLPVIQNAIQDAISFKKAGLTAILLYPMNALANDQLIRIDEYLESAGFNGLVKVAKYDRGTTQAQREDLRKNPPHILLTNYMMLEYLLVRPADREDIFANHRCRFLVLDEVHTYRGALGTNIALLVRRLKAHLKQARQDWGTSQAENLQKQRFPELLAVGTSATIKSESEAGLSRTEWLKKRDAEIQGFFSKLSGFKQDSIKILGEELQDIVIPSEAKYSVNFSVPVEADLSDDESIRKEICKLAGINLSVDLDTALKSCRIIWDFNAWLIKKPMSISQLVQKIIETVPARKSWTLDNIKKEVEMALLLGAVLPESAPANLRLKAHQFMRGGWQFYRCINPECGKLYPKGEEKCECGHVTAPLYLCRFCGADYLRFIGDEEPTVLRPSNDKSDIFEWMIYQPEKFGELHDEDDEIETPEDTSERINRRIVGTMKGRAILYGSLDPYSLNFSANQNMYSLKVVLAPARNRCLCCGNTAGSRNVVSSVTLGTSAALKVLCESTIEALEDAHKDEVTRDKKERILIFSDSRQDAAHQARFIRFASRYDRMRRRTIYLLKQEGHLTIQRMVELLTELGVTNKDNPYIPEGESRWIPEEARKRMQAYEEAPLLDELAVNAGFRATVFNLGMAEIVYNQLDEYIKVEGKDLLKQLGLGEAEFLYLCKCIMDKMRTLACLNREMIKYHPSNQRHPEYFKTANWERNVKHPKGFAADNSGNPIGYVDQHTLPQGIKVHNPWRRQNSGGKGPAVQRLFEQLMNRFGGANPNKDLLVNILEFLKRGSFLVASELFGYQDSAKLIQVNSECIRLKLAEEHSRYKCSVCGVIINSACEGFPCPFCHGRLVVFTDQEVNKSRYVRRIKMATLPILDAEEHTAQVSNEVRLNAEERFKADSEISKLNILACSPTLEMGIDVGGLDAILLRNIPPRPDNYAQRGGRAGRRQRIGLVLGYVRNTPHDQYFYEHPEEMIAGEVIVPQLSLENKDILFRHLNAIVFGAAEPGLAGRMVEYIDPMGEIKNDIVDSLLKALQSKIEHTISIAKSAWGEDILSIAGVSDDSLREVLSKLSEKTIDVFNRTSRQVKELRIALESYYRGLQGGRAGQRAGDLVARILGIPTAGARAGANADDRSSGYPLRRFAEFGILPGYEFPDQPSSLRLRGEIHEEDLISVNRRFGIAQYQPEAQVYARAQRWKVVGLDTSSPWNPFGAEQGWPYRLCSKCNLRYDANEPRCPRCKDVSAGAPINSVEYAGFVARKDEAPVLDEEERFATRSFVIGYPQWDGQVVGRWIVGPGWGLRLSHGEKVVWLNEGNRPKEIDLERGIHLLHAEAKGFLLCPSCGHILMPQIPEQNNARGRRSPQRTGSQDQFNHSPRCEKRGLPENPIAIHTENKIEVLRLIVPVPDNISEQSLYEWGYSLGYSLRTGMRHRYSLDGGEVEFILEGPWKVKINEITYNQAALSFIDPNIGGSGYLPKIAQEFDKVAKEAEAFLEHKNCESSCYRCLKAYQNQRHHEYLKWPGIISDLEALYSVSPEQRPLERGDMDDPSSWLEAYSAGVGSPLELKFLRLFEKHGLPVEKQVPVSPSASEPPISIADFAIPGRRIAIYIDSATFHVGQALRRDKYIREKLKNGSAPWKIVELKVQDLAKGKLLIDEINN